MAKVSAVNKNDKRIKLSDRLFKKRQALKKIVMDKKISNNWLNSHIIEVFKDAFSLTWESLYIFN